MNFKVSIFSIASLIVACTLVIASPEHVVIVKPSFSSQFINKLWNASLNSETLVLGDSQVIKEAVIQFDLRGTTDPFGRPPSTIVFETEAMGPGVGDGKHINIHLVESVGDFHTPGSSIANARAIFVGKFAITQNIVTVDLSSHISHISDTKVDLLLSYKSDKDITLRMRVDGGSYPGIVKLYFDESKGLKPKEEKKCSGKTREAFTCTESPDGKKRYCSRSVECKTERYCGTKSSCLTKKCACSRNCSGKIGCNASLKCQASSRRSKCCRHHGSSSTCGKLEEAIELYPVKVVSYENGVMLSQSFLPESVELRAENSHSFSMYFDLTDTYIPSFSDATQIDLFLKAFSPQNTVAKGRKLKVSLITNTNDEMRAEKVGQMDIREIGEFETSSDGIIRIPLVEVYSYFRNLHFIGFLIESSEEHLMLVPPFDAPQIGKILLKE